MFSLSCDYQQGANYLVYYGGKNRSSRITAYSMGRKVVAIMGVCTSATNF